jgi:dipeptidyl aminopeptidase/acylaminoacyl peptidase
VRVFGFEYKPDLLVVGGNFGAAIPGIHYYSLKEDRVVHTLLSAKNYAADQIATPLFSEGLQALVGLHLDAEHPTSKWIASPMQRLQDSFDRGFADSRNRLAAWSTDLAWMLVERQFGDRPSVFMLVDNRAAKVSPLFTNGGEVDPAQTASVEYFTFLNRANVKLGGYVTKPKTNKGGALPLVVMLGSDPWNRKHNFGWDNEAQFLAKKGFAILRLNFRGTGQLVESGALEWKDPEDPRKCVEDIVDAVEFLGPNHGIDIKRVGIVGFGGGAGWLAVYAPMAAPDSFRCAASLGGIYDLEEYRETAGADPLRNMGGIPCADEEKGLSIEVLRSLSPTASPDKIGVPVFVAYGQWSPQRYTDHVAKFQREAKRAGVEFEKTFIGSFYGTSLGEHNDLAEYFAALASFLQKRM